MVTPGAEGGREESGPRTRTRRLVLALRLGQAPSGQGWEGLWVQTRPSSELSSPHSHH